MLVTYLHACDMSVRPISEYAEIDDGEESVCGDESDAISVSSVEDDVELIREIHCVSSDDDFWLPPEPD